MAQARVLKAKVSKGAKAGASENLYTYIMNAWTGGTAEGTRLGYANAFNDSLGVDYRTDPDRLQVMPVLARETYVDGQVRFIIRESTDTWFYANSGSLYRRNGSKIYDYKTQIAASTGNGFEFFNNAIYYAGTATLNKMTTPAGTPTLVPNEFVSVTGSFVNLGDVDQTVGVVAPPVASALATTITSPEVDTNKIPFVPNKTSFAGAIIPFSTVGAGAVTLTLHDLNNTVVTTITKAGADIAGPTRFTPATPINIIRGGFYHIHLTVASGVTSILTHTLNDMSTTYMKTYFRPIESGTDHMMRVFTNKLCYCNGRFLGTIDDATVLNSEAMTFPPDEVAHCVETIGDYIAVATWNGTTAGASGRSRIYFWDGTAPTFNSFIDVNGQVNAMITNNNLLYIIHGTQNIISVYSGALTLLRRIKFVGQNDTCLVAEGGLSVWEGLLVWGINSGTTSLDRAVYSLGTKSKDYPETLNKEFQTSTKDVSNKVSISAIYGLDAENLFVCWEQTTPTTTTFTANITSTASTLVSTISVFTAADVGRQLKNTTDTTYRTITGYTSGTTVTVDTAIGDTWDGDTISMNYYYGIDNIDTDAKETEAYVSTLRYDAGVPNIEKMGNSISLRTVALETNQSVDIYYRLNNNGDFIYFDVMSGAENPGIFYKSFDFEKQFFEVEFKLVLNNDGITAPEILSFELYFNVATNYQLGTRVAP
jgi:hypothetical protein